jgi:hypothetical protein
VTGSPLTEEQGVVWTALHDADRALTAAETAAATTWPGARTFGVSRTRRVLRELEALGRAERRRGAWTPLEAPAS